MKKISLLFFFVVLVARSIFAQAPVATLEHGGTSKAFYGQGALIDAYNASANGDAIYLSAGYFNPPQAFEKGITVIGSGHFPDMPNEPKRTTLKTGFRINKGADNFKLEGIYINGDLDYDGSNSLNYISFIRCRINHIRFNTVSKEYSKNNCLFEECFFSNLNFSNYGNNLLIRHCYINGALYHINGGSLIEGNIFGNKEWSYPLDYVMSSQIRNNIFLLNTNALTPDCVGNYFNNNVIVSSTITFDYNFATNNYLGIPQTEIFVNQTGNTYDYTHDYHLKNPEKYIGTDGTQVGLYGGVIPFKEKGLPSNPQITSAKVDNATDKDGKLNISITVEAQKGN